jgi:hypothetical protein
MEPERYGIAGRERMGEIDPSQRLVHHDGRADPIHGCRVDLHPTEVRGRGESESIRLIYPRRLTRVDRLRAREGVRIGVEINRRQRAVGAASIIDGGPALDAVALGIEANVDLIAKARRGDCERGSNRAGEDEEREGDGAELQDEERERDRAELQAVTSWIVRIVAGTPPPKSV